jgi:hypothetical protein
MATGAVVARILTQYSDKGSKAATKDINKLGKSFDAFAKKSAKAFGIAALAATAFAVKIGKDAVEAAVADQKSQALLANSLRNTVGATDDAIAGVERHITALQKQFSVADDELRPAFGRLAAAFDSTTAAQEAMQIALNVSAFAGVDLAAASEAIIKASQGQYRAITKLVPGIGSATLATKDFGKITDKVSKIVGGAAATRAGTLEGKMNGLKIAFGEVMETLGYALLPVMEKFVTLVTTKLLPRIEAFVALNKDKLAAGFQLAAEMAFKLLTVAVAFSDWCANNMGIIRGMAALIAGMFVVGRIAAFITAIRGIIAVMALLRTTSIGAAIATAFATSGVSIALGTAALATAGLGVYTLNKMVGPNADAGTSKGGKGISPRGNSNNRDFSVDPYTPPVVKGLSDFTTGLNKSTKALKTASTLQEKITAEAVRKNLARQATLSGSPTIAIGGSGSLAYGNRGSTTVVVNNAGSVITNEDLVTTITDGILRTTRRGFGGNNGRFALVAE